MNTEEKILEMLTQMQTDISGLKAGQTQMQTTQEQMQADISGLKAGQAQMQEDIHRINGRLELDVEKRFDAVNEGIDAILEKMVPGTRIKALEDDVALMKTVIKAMSQRLEELEQSGRGTA